MRSGRMQCRGRDSMIPCAGGYLTGVWNERKQ